MAKALLQHKLRRLGLAHAVFVDSAGTKARLGQGANEKSIETCRANGVAGLESHQARLITPRDLQLFDWILCMDLENEIDVLGMAQRGSGVRARVRQLGSSPVPDPWGLSLQDYH
ncbi:hypothetical protein HDU91_006598, partial [Kappamyces sp. JEL0680]